MTTIKITIDKGIPDVDLSTLPAGWTLEIQDIDDDCTRPEDRDIITTFTGTGPIYSADLRASALGHYRMQASAWVTSERPELMEFVETGMITEPYGLYEEVREIRGILDRRANEEGSDDDEVWEAREDWFAFLDDIRDLYQPEIDL